MDCVIPRRVLPALGDASLFQDRWPDTPYHSVRTATGLQSTITWSAIDALLNDQPIQAPAFRMVRDNKLLPVESISRSDQSTSRAVKGFADPVRVMAELGRGATLVLQSLNRFWPPLNEVCRRLAAEIGHTVSVNAYLTPRSARGFGAHHDPYHAWLAQVEGTKTWQLWAPGGDPAADRPDREVKLAEGDVLWIPRGWWHAGSSGDRPSLHLSFTVWATKIEDVLRAMVADLLQQAEITRELPPNSLRDADCASRTVAEAASEITRLIAKIDAHALTDRILDVRLQRFHPLPARSVAAIVGEAPDARFHVHPEGIIHRTVDASGSRLRTADAVVTVTPDQMAACEGLLDRTGTFRLDEVGEPPDGINQKLLDQLIDARLVCAAECGRRG